MAMTMAQARIAVSYAAADLRKTALRLEELRATTKWEVCDELLAALEHLYTAQALLDNGRGMARRRTEQPTG